MAYLFIISKTFDFNENPEVNGLLWVSYNITDLQEMAVKQNKTKENKTKQTTTY